MRSILVPALALAACTPGLRPRPDLTTTAERSGWLRTGRYAEAVALCDAFAEAYPGKARCERFGTTPERRELVALVVSADGAITPAAAAARQRPVILVQAGIHAGEIEGKDAGFELLRDALDGKVAAGGLAAATIVFIPVINADGHERFGPNNRPNQRGPEEMGFRTTSAGLNINRDHMKVDTPEMAAQLGLWRRWNPVMYIDLHTTDGAKFEHDISVAVSPAIRAGGLGDAASALSREIQARLTALGHLPVDFYPSFVDYDDPASGFSHGEPPPRFSHGYAAARDRIGILVETHSWRTYAERVRSTYHAVQAVLERAVDDAAGWRTLAAAAEREDLAGQEVVLALAPTGKSTTIEFRGYHYERVASEISGGTWTVYDETRPEVWTVPLLDELAPSLTVTAPRAGYVVTAGFADTIAARLDAHGVRYLRLEAALTADAEVFRATAVTLGKPFEGRATARVEGAWAHESREIAAGSLWIPIAQPLGRLAVHLFEPTAPDSFTAWGFFDAAFEQKEYMESYVAEEAAREMLADPEVRAAFDAALADPAFAASPEARLDFFFRRHPSWDERVNLIPVLRLDTVPAEATPP